MASYYVGARAAMLAKQKGRDSKEVEYLEEAFKQADLNADGKVDINEYISILKNRGLYTNRKEVQEMFLLADKDGDKTLSKEEIGTEIGRLNDCTTAFKHMDLNKDNVVDPWEMEQSTKLNEKQATAAVKVADKNEDGVLDKAEFVSMMNKNRKNNPEVQKGDRMFDMLDTNKDGYLSSKELSKAMDPSKAYLITKSKRVDKNRDGKIDRQEYRDFVQKK